MKKIFTLLALLVTFVGVNGAWAEVTVVKSWDFYTASVAASAETTLSFSGTTTINKISCDNATGDWEGICLQGSGNWFLNRGGAHKYDGLYNNNGGGRIFGILNVKAGDIITINANGGLPTSATNGTYDAENSTTTSGIYTVTEDGSFGISLTRYFQITTVTVARELAALEVPTYSITGVDGTQREVTLSCLTPDATIKYNTTDDKSAAGWTDYSAPFYTSETTLYAYSEVNGTSSDVITITTGAGTEITLNVPTFTINSYNSETATSTVTLISSQNGVLLAPTATISYTIDGGTETNVASGTIISVADGSVLKMWSVASGYTNSTEVSITATPPCAYANIIAETYNGIVSANSDFKLGTEIVSTVNTTNYYNLYYNSGETLVSDNLLANNVGTNYMLRANGIYCGGSFNLAIPNMQVGDYITLKGVYGNAAFDITGNTSDLIEDEWHTIAGNTYTFKVKKAGTVRFTMARYGYLQSITVQRAPEAITMNEYGKGTYVTTNALDFSGITDVKAYVATAQNGSDVTFEPVTTVPAGTPLLIKGTANTTTNIPFATSATAPAENLLLAGTGAAVESEADGKYNFILNKIGEEVGFYRAAGNTVAVDRAYLSLDSNIPTGAKVDLIFSDEEATGINNVNAVENTNEKIFNLAGQQMKSAVKGVYIKNGKKYVK